MSVANITSRTVADQIVLKGKFKEGRKKAVEHEMILRLVPESSTTCRLELLTAKGKAWLFRIDQEGGLTLCGDLDLCHHEIHGIKKLITDSGEFDLDETGSLSEYVRLAGRKGGQKISGGSSIGDKLELESGGGVVIQGIEFKDGTIKLGDLTLRDLFAPLTISNELKRAFDEIAELKHRIVALESNTHSDPNVTRLRRRGEQAETKQEKRED